MPSLDRAVQYFCLRFLIYAPLPFPLVLFNFHYSIIAISISTVMYLKVPNKPKSNTMTQNAKSASNRYDVTWLRFLLINEWFIENNRTFLWNSAASVWVGMYVSQLASATVAISKYPPSMLFLALCSATQQPTECYVEVLLQWVQSYGFLPAGKLRHARGPTVQV